MDRDESGRRLRGLQIARRLLAPLGHDVVADLLAFHQAAHAGALHRADVHEHVLAAVARLYGNPWRSTIAMIFMPFPRQLGDADR